MLTSCRDIKIACFFFGGGGGCSKRNLKIKSSYCFNDDFISIFQGRATDFRRVRDRHKEMLPGRPIQRENHENLRLWLCKRWREKGIVYICTSKWPSLIYLFLLILTIFYNKKREGFGQQALPI